jgi:hypothetical protein
LKVLKNYKYGHISYEVPNALIFLSFQLPGVFNLGYAVKILIAISRVAYLVH